MILPVGSTRALSSTQGALGVSVRVLQLVEGLVGSFLANLGSSLTCRRPKVNTSMTHAVKKRDAENTPIQAHVSHKLNILNLIQSFFGEGADLVTWGFVDYHPRCNRRTRVGIRLKFLGVHNSFEVRLRTRQLRLCQGPAPKSRGSRQRR